MGSLPKRLCARGEQCTQYARLGKPQELSAYNKDTICGPCREAERDVQVNDPYRDSSASTRESKARTRKRQRPESTTRREAPAERQLRQLRQLTRKLVLQLYQERGEFWEKVRDMRSRWGITPVVQLPPEVRRPLHYLRLPEQYPRSNLARLQEPTLYPRDMEIPERNKWEWELDLIRIETVPERYSQASEWRWFVSACVLFDPPERGLIGFAECGGVPYIVGLRDGDGFEMPVSPVQKSPHPLAVEGAWRQFYEELIREIGERHLKPLGLNIHKMYSDVLHNSKLHEELRERLARLPCDYSIPVDEETDVEGVKQGYKIIRAEQKGPKPGAAPLDPLVAIECAVRHDDDDWELRKLVECYDLPSENSADNHVEYGRKLRRNRTR